jgi:hypothetical protein
MIKTDVTEEISTKLIQSRTTNQAFHFGKSLHYIPYEDVYVYFSYPEEKRVMVVMNNNLENQNLELSRYGEGIEGNTQVSYVISEKSFSLPISFEVAAETTLIFKLSL